MTVAPGIAVSFGRRGLSLVGMGGIWSLERRWDDLELRGGGGIGRGRCLGEDDGLDALRLARALGACGRRADAAVLRDLAGADWAFTIAETAATPEGHAGGIPSADIIRFYTACGVEGAATRLAREAPGLAALIPGVHGPRDADVTAEGVLRRIAERAGLPALARRQADRLAAGLWPGAAAAEVEAILSLPWDWAPIGPRAVPDEVAAFRAIACATAPIAAAVGHRRFLMASSGRWDAFARRVARRLPEGEGTHAALAAGVRSLVEAGGDLGREALVPSVLAAGLARPGTVDAHAAAVDGLRCLVADRGLVGVFEALGRRPPSGGTHALDHWPAAFADRAMPAGTLVTCLSDVPALRDEGADGCDAHGLRGLDHCVARYAGDCLSGERVVLSVRGPDGRRLSTAMLDPGPWRVVEHRGRSNAPPPAEAEDALRSFLVDVHAERAAPSRAWLSQGWRSPPRPPDPAASEADAGLEAWSAALPARLRSKDALAGAWGGVLWRGAAPAKEPEAVRPRNTGIGKIGVTPATHG